MEFFPLETISENPVITVAIGLCYCKKQQYILRKMGLFLARIRVYRVFDSAQCNEREALSSFYSPQKDKMTCYIYY